MGSGQASITHSVARGGATDGRQLAVRDCDHRHTLELGAPLSSTVLGGPPAVTGTDWGIARTHCAFSGLQDNDGAGVTPGVTQTPKGAGGALVSRPCKGPYDGNVDKPED